MIELEWIRHAIDVDTKLVSDNDDFLYCLHDTAVFVTMLRTCGSPPLFFKQKRKKKFKPLTLLFLIDYHSFNSLLKGMLSKAHL